MPMFQADEARSVSVHPPDPARTPFGGETSNMVADHLDTLLGEHLLPLRIRHGDEDEPYLLAVDASGQPVVVEVVALLDEVAVLRALRYAGRAARLSTQALASAYQGGPDRFASHLAAFRETVPATSLLSTTVRGGSRLLLVCSGIDEGMDDVVEFLLQPAWQVEVLQVGVSTGDDGSRIVDVSPLTRTPPPRRAMEPTSLRLVRSSDVPGAPPTPPHGLPGRLTPPGGTPTPLFSSTHTMPLTPAIDPRPIIAAAPRRTSALHRDLSGQRDLGDADATRLMPAITPPPFAVRIGMPSAQDLPRAQPADEQDDEQVGGPDDAHRVVWSLEPTDRPAPGLPYAFTGVSPGDQAVPDPFLVALAGKLGAASVLVWHRQRSGECYEALLHPDGFIELPDGSRHTHPDSAAEAACRAEAPVDGWQVWRLDTPTGPTLAEVCSW